MGYREFHGIGRATRLPKMIGYQAAGSAPIFHNRVVEKPETVATAIRIGNPASWEKATAAMRDSGGAVDIVTDEQILSAQAWLASNEGIFVEPASAASIAGLMKCCGKDRCTTCPLPAIPEGSRIVCTVTGHGLKDPDVASKQIGNITTAKADKRAILDLLAK